jgi:hypothetical protein
MSLPENYHGNIIVICGTYLLINLFIYLFIHSNQLNYSINDAMRSSIYAIKWNEYME